MGAVGSCLQEEIFAYDTPKIVQIKSKCLGVLHRLVQITIIAYVVLWVFIYNLGYQYIDNAAVSGITTKVKGVAYTNSTDDRVGQRVWDTSDLIVPSQLNGAFFISTNVLVTHKQRQGVCAERDTYQARCEKDSDCLPDGEPYHLGHGVSLGSCNQTTGSCMVRAWCPIENDTLPEGGKQAVIEDSKDFTVFIKNHVYFPYYKRMRSNLIESVTKTYMRSCLYHPQDDPYCPIFRVGDIVSLTRQPPLQSGDRVRVNDSDFNDIAVKGGVISITIGWDCNLDRDERECKPEYRFERLDDYGGNDIAKGFNFRYPIYWRESGEMNPNRDLVKAYGILFLVNTDARARKFDAVTFFQNVGSGLALLGVASVCCDIFLMYFHRKKNFFKNHIFHNVDKSEEESEPDARQDRERGRPDAFDAKSGKNGNYLLTPDTQASLLPIPSPTGSDPSNEASNLF